jgi:hypothetical protein
MTTPQDFYRPQSTLSDPGPYAALYDALPDDLPSLARIIQGFYIHYRGGPASGIPISEERLLQVDSRRIETILSNLVAADDRPLAMTRENDNRVVGCCRDAALLLCSMLRHKGIPARIRYGFAAYLNFGHRFAVDHVVTEYWNEGRWTLADADIPEGARSYFGIDFDLMDIPRDRFLVGGAVWQGVRAGRLNPDEYGVHPELPDPDLRGEGFIRGDLARDLAFLNKQEYLLWDSWGMSAIDKPLSEAQLALLDEVAVLSINAHDDANFEAIRAFEHHPAFDKPETIMCYSPVQAFYQVRA